MVCVILSLSVWWSFGCGLCQAVFVCLVVVWLWFVSSCLCLSGGRLVVVCVKLSLSVWWSLVVVCVKLSLSGGRLVVICVKLSLSVWWSFGCGLCHTVLSVWWLFGCDFCHTLSGGCFVVISVILCLVVCLVVISVIVSLVVVWL